jgi:hypothetical protein
MKMLVFAAALGFVMCNLPQVAQYILTNLVVFLGGSWLVMELRVSHAQKLALESVRLEVVTIRAEKQSLSALLRMTQNKLFDLHVQQSAQAIEAAMLRKDN